MENRVQWYGVLSVMAVINVALATGSWWALAVLPGCVFLELLLEYIFDEEKAKDYGVIILLVINILLIPAAADRIVTDFRDEETALVTNVAVSTAIFENGKC